MTTTKELIISGKIPFMSIDILMLKEYHYHEITFLWDWFYTDYIDTNVP